MNNIDKKISEISETNRIGILVSIETEIEENKYEFGSPLEKLFFYAWNISYQSIMPIFSIIPQYKISQYRVDFLIDPLTFFVNHPSKYSDKTLKFIDKNLKRLVVEIDGHDFHERTKEQAKKDKERDRFLQSKNYQVFRFTGSEILNNLSSCSWEVYSQAQRNLDDFLKDFKG